MNSMVGDALGAAPDLVDGTTSSREHVVRRVAEEVRPGGRGTKEQSGAKRERASPISPCIKSGTILEIPQIA